MSIWKRLKSLFGIHDECLHYSRCSFCGFRLQGWVNTIGNYRVVTGKHTCEQCCMKTDHVLIASGDEAIQVWKEDRMHETFAIVMAIDEACRK